VCRVIARGGLECTCPPHPCQRCIPDWCRSGEFTGVRRKSVRNEARRCPTVIPNCPSIDLLEFACNLTWFLIAWSLSRNSVVNNSVTHSYRNTVSKAKFNVCGDGALPSSNVIPLPTSKASDIQLLADTGHPQLRSSSERIHVVPRTHNSFSDRSFPAAGLHVWNALTSNLWQDINYKYFNKSLKGCRRRIVTIVVFVHLRSLFIYLLTYLLTSHPRGLPPLNLTYRPFHL